MSSVQDPWRRRLLVLLSALLVVAAGPVEGAPVDLRRGLVTVYRDASSAEVARLEPCIALALKPGESPHPRLRADGGVRWQGRLRVVRDGGYRFRVRLVGRFRLSIAGAEVLAAEVRGKDAAIKESAEVRLDAGVHPLKAEFTRLAGGACVELFWQAGHFRREPLPSDHLGHLPEDVPDRLAADTLVERGRRLVEESGCVRCHLSAEDNPMVGELVARSGPDLSRIGRRVRANWLLHWLESPRRLRPGATMPELFPPDEAGRVERYAVARYLATLGGSLKATPRQNEDGRRSAGTRHYSRLGCVACHGPADEAKDDGRSFVFVSPPRVYPLVGLGSKSGAEALSVYLRNPDGHSPNMLLQLDEADDLARWLCRSRVEDIGDELPPAPPADKMLAAFRRVDSRAEELMEFRRLPADRQWPDLGKRIVIDKGCNNCHVIAPDGKPFASVQASASLEEIRQPAKHTIGCLADGTKGRGPAPRFVFTEEDRSAIRIFLREGLTGAGSPAPAYAARNDLERFNCLACHIRDGEGGLPPSLLERLRRTERAEHVEAVEPPPLTGAGHKLTTPWARQVLLAGARARPWMSLRMPQFGESHVGRLPEALAALEGGEPDDAIHEAAPTTRQIEAGRLLAGKSGFGCVSCHDLAGIPNTGTRGTDLAQMTRRVRRDWYRRWLEQPQRIHPGTRMPAVFVDGKSLMDKVLDGRADAQGNALWAYFALGPSLPLPEGMKRPAAGRSK